MSKKLILRQGYALLFIGMLFVSNGFSPYGSPTSPMVSKVTFHVFSQKVYYQSNAKFVLKLAANIKTSGTDGTSATESVEAVPNPDIPQPTESKINEETKKNFFQKLVALFKKKDKGVLADPNGNGDYNPGGIFPITIILTSGDQGLPPRSLKTRTYNYENAQEFDNRFLLEVEAYLKTTYPID